MTRILLALPTAIAACTAPGLDRTIVGQVDIGPETYPIEATAPDRWRVHIDGRPVPCAKPTEKACYWSARHHLTAQEQLDDLG